MRYEGDVCLSDEAERGIKRDLYISTASEDEGYIKKTERKKN